MRENVRSCRKRSSLICIGIDRSPISSRNSVPPSAASARPMRRCAAERPLLVPEQLGLHQGFRQRRAVQRHERLVLAHGKALDRPRHEFLASPARAANKHRSLARSHLAYLLVHGAHLAAVADQVARIVRQHVAQPAVLFHQRLTFRQLLAAHRRRLRRDVRDDLQQSHVALQVGSCRRPRLVQAVDRQCAYHLPEMHQRHADERDRTLVRPRPSPVEEAPVDMDVRHHLALARLRHASCHALPDAVAPQRPLVVVKPARSLDAQLVALQKRHRPTKHPHAPLQDVEDLVQQGPHIPFPYDNRTDLLNYRYLRRQFRVHGSTLYQTFVRLTINVKITKSM